MKELPDNDLRQNLTLLAEMEKKIAHDILETKRKDDLRGARIIDDYAEAHPPSEVHSFVKETMRLAENRRKEINRLLRSIPSSGLGRRSKA